MKLPTISDAEWEVMNVVWDTHPITASEVVDRLDGQTDWSPRTIKTMLNRLLTKGALSHQVDGKRYLYRPLLSREQCIMQASESFLSRVFGGAVVPMIVNLVRNAKLSEEEIAKLRKFLEENDRSKGR